MAKLAGEVYDQELWIRCPMCGDSPRRLHIAHFSINLLSGAYFCVRCQSGGYLRPGQFIDLFSRLPIDTVSKVMSAGGNAGSGLEIDENRLETRAAWGRFSLIERHAYTDDNDVQWEAFPTRDPKTGDAIGWYLRGPDKRSLIAGESGLGWSYDGPVVSQYSQPARLVEGPYDVIDPADVCCYGIISSGALKSLGYGHAVLLCPDSDVWRDDALRYRFYRTLEACIDGKRGMPSVAGVEVLPEGRDPDEVPVSLRLVIDGKTVYTRLKALQNRSQSHADTKLGNLRRAGR